jgi:hypothetical protein
VRRLSLSNSRVIIFLPVLAVFWPLFCERAAGLR